MGRSSKYPAELRLPTRAVEELLVDGEQRVLLFGLDSNTEAKHERGEPDPVDEYDPEHSRLDRRHALGSADNVRFRQVCSSRGTKRSPAQSTWDAYSTPSCTRCTINVMVTTTLSNFRAHQSEVLDAAQRAPVEILSRGSRRRAVVVSPEFFDRALQALEDQADIRDAATARREQGSVSHEDLMAELGL